jgi:predicted 3-demethylubiquinone-9 3-methyltransferase (glyoxalase superfamily)
MQNRIQPCLWFDRQAEEAARFYTSIFRNARIVRITRYGKEGFDVHGMPEGSVMTVEFELDGQPFTALNGGVQQFKFNESISLQVLCDTQLEIDHYWGKLSAGGDKGAQQCGWLKDRYGVSWQVAPRDIGEWVSGDDEPARRAMRAMLQMKKIDIEGLRRAREAKAA